MINPSFYILDRKVQSFLGGKVAHFPLRLRIKVLATTSYIVKDGDTMYNIASRLFGNIGEYNWTIISEINFLRKPDELIIGEEIKLPLVILSETETRLPTYEQNTSTAIKV